jgi:hypothetical protein
MDQAGKVELELVAVARGVGTLHFAELALEAGSQDPVRLPRIDLANVAVVLPVEQVEEEGKAVAVLEAHAAAVANLEGPLDLSREPRPSQYFGSSGSYESPAVGL